MCEPTTLAIMSAAGTIFSAYGQYQQAQSQQESLNYQSAVARNNAQITEWQAQDSIRRGQEDEQRQRMRTAQIKGTQRAGMAASGIDISEGSAAQIQADTDFMGEQDALTIRDNANREAWGFRNQGQQYKADSQAAKATAKSISPIMAAGGTLLSGAGTLASAGKMVSDKWYGMANKGNAAAGVKITSDPWATY